MKNLCFIMIGCCCCLMLSSCEGKQVLPINKDKTLEALRSSRYTIDEEAVTLVDGIYQERPSPDSATFVMNLRLLEDFMVLGDLDGNDDDAIVVLINSPGGSGSFYYLAVVLNGVNTETLYLGDRVILQSLSSEKGVVTVSYLKHGSNAPMAQPPEILVTQSYRLDTGKFTPVDAGS